MYLETKATFTSLPSCLKRKQKKKIKKGGQTSETLYSCICACKLEKNKTIVYVLVSIAHNITRINTLYKQKAKGQWIKRFLADQH